MITPQIRAFHSPDIDRLESFQPASANFAFVLQMTIGPTDGQGEETFDVEVATVAWLEQRYAEEGFAAGEGRLLIFRYDWPRLEAYLRERVRDCSGEHWEDVAEKLSRFSRWEFEDYQP